MNLLNPRHHLLLGNQMIDPLQQSEQTLHAPAPLVQHLVRIPRLGETHHPGRTIDFGVDRLRRDQLTDIRLRLLLIQIQQLREPRHGDAGVVFGNDADIVLDDALAQIEEAGVGLGVFGRGCVGEDVGGAEVGAKFLGDDGPTHEFGDCEKFEELGFGGDEGVAGVGVDAVEEVGLFVVVGRKDDVEDYSLEDLGCCQ